MIVILTEEESMSATLDTLVGLHFPDVTKGVDWIPLWFQGKSDLEKNIPTKMKRWNFGRPFFIIVRDQDGGDCRAVKKKLHDIASKGGKAFSIRVVCMELESWLLGELDAVEAAYPASEATKFKAKKKFRDPDSLSNASQELERLIRVRGKVGRAKRIAKHFQPSRCRSKSFAVFWRTVSQNLRK